MKNIKDTAKKAALKAQEVLLGTLRNMSPEAVGARYRAVDQAKADRDQAMIRENFGNEENYRNTLGLGTPEGDALFDTPAAKGMRFLRDSIVKARGLIKK